MQLSQNMAHCTLTLEKIKQAITESKYHSPYCTDKIHTQVVSSQAFKIKMNENKHKEVGKFLGVFHAVRLIHDDEHHLF
jgi:hypothetical protein